ncbi:MAG: hypothetical protein Q7S83_03850 [bacterium]|nr:hypothetical protein [bacterium]
MSQKRSEFLGSFGTAFQVFKALTDEVLGMGGGDADLRRIETDKGLRQKLAQLIVGVQEKAANIFKVIVDYSLSLADMIKQVKSDWTNSDITERHFPRPSIPRGISKKAEVALELIHFNRSISSDDAIAELKRLGYRPATIWELLVFGMTYPEKQREFPIVALGSVWRRWGGCRGVAYLWSSAVGRYLFLGWFEGGWVDGYRFLAVRES